MKRGYSLFKKLICFGTLLFGMILIYGCHDLKASYLELSPEKVEIKVGDTTKITANTDGNSSILWEIDNINIASITQDGEVTALNIGTVIVTASIDELSQSITLTIITDKEPIIEEEEMPTNTLIIHYYRYDNEYNKWAIWLWSKIPEGNGEQIEFEKDESNKTITDNYGSITIISLEKYKVSTRLGIIIKTASSWDKKDVGFDRFFDVPPTSKGGKIHIYLVQNDERIGTSLDDINGPSRGDKIEFAHFIDLKTINFSLTSQTEVDRINLLINNQLVNIVPTLDGKSGKFILSENMNFKNKYSILVNFETGESKYIVSISALYSTKEFENEFNYLENDLGVSIQENKSVFKLWAPISDKVTLNIYDTGTPLNLKEKDASASDNPIAKYDMTYNEKGVWYTTINQNLHGKYYTYTIYNNNIPYEIIDPYAKSAGINGLRGMIVDFDQTNPDDYFYNSIVNNINSPTNAIIYEIHVRDLSSHYTWNGPKEYAGKFMAFTVEGTTYSQNGLTVSTGLDHLSELGITHVQILPFFDQKNNEANDPNKFNWGYNPLNYNVLEGAYSTNPYDGLSRIIEFKKLVLALQKKNINVIMDVVYNHMGDAASSSFEKIIPGYFFRLTTTGQYSNGSGCGNETASDRFMMQKYIIDSTLFYTNEYNISGYRFDLMALHDIETMKLVETNLKAINPNILVYGEPWNGGETPLNDEISANKKNLSKMNTVGAFNDDFRDAVKGSVFNKKEGGFVQGNISEGTIDKIKYGICGGIEFEGIDKKFLSYEQFWNTSPIKTINYVSCHDNNTLYDKIMLTTNASQKIDGFVKYMFRQASSLVFTSQGIAFFQGGDEFMRSKALSNGEYDSNSYESPDEVNQLKYDLKCKTDNYNTFLYYKGLIAIRKFFPELTINNQDDIRQHLTFHEIPEDENIICYSITSLDSKNYSEILVIHNGGIEGRITLPEQATWNLIANRNQCSMNTIKQITSSRTYIESHETLIMYK